MFSLLSALFKRPSYIDQEKYLGELQGAQTELVQQINALEQQGSPTNEQLAKLQDQCKRVQNCINKYLKQITEDSLAPFAKLVPQSLEVAKHHIARLQGQPSSKSPTLQARNWNQLFHTYQTCLPILYTQLPRSFLDQKLQDLQSQNIRLYVRTSNYDLVTAKELQEFGLLEQFQQMGVRV